MCGMGRETENLTVIAVGILGPRIGRRDMPGRVRALELVPEQALRGDRVPSDVVHVAEVELEVAAMVRGDEELDVQNPARLERRRHGPVAKVLLVAAGRIAAKAVPSRRFDRLRVRPSARARGARGCGARRTSEGYRQE